MTRFRIATVGLLLLSLLTAPGCSGSKRGTQNSPAKPVSSSAATSQTVSDRLAANRLAAAVQDQALSHNYPNEPRSGFRPLNVESGDSFFATIEAVETSPAAITFDVGQLYIGEAAYKEAARDGLPDLPNPAWTRNRFRKSQTFRVDPDAPVILQGSHAIERDTLYGGETRAPLIAVSWGEFAGRFDAEPEYYGASSGYIINCLGDTVTSIVEVYFP